MIRQKCELWVKTKQVNCTFKPDRITSHSNFKISSAVLHIVRTENVICLSVFTYRFPTDTTNLSLYVYILSEAF